MKTLIRIGFLAISLNFILAFWVSVGLAQTKWEKYPGNPVLDVGPSGSGDDVSVSCPFVLKDADTIYKMWYTANDGSTQGIALAHSSDGVNWTKDSTGLVIEPGPSGSWDEHHPSNVHVLKESDGTYKMWYAAWGPGAEYSRIGYATSLDGINWTKYSGNPVLREGLPGEWDDCQVTHPFVMKESDGTYKMWFQGGKGCCYYWIGYATSPDGINWTKYPGNPVLSPDLDGWDYNGVGTPFVLNEGDRFYAMWYGGGPDGGHKIGLAISQDGINWDRHPDNPILGVGAAGTWDDRYLISPSIIKESDGVLRMWYHGKGSSNRIGFANSNDDCWDLDGDVHMDEACGGWDCDDTDPSVYPGSVEGAIDDPTCSDGIDNDCDGEIDTDSECIVILVPDEQTTIQDAINAAEDRTTILVAPGIYRENIDFMGKDVTVCSVDGPVKTIIDGGRAGSTVTFANGDSPGAVLCGFTIKNGSGTYLLISPYIGFGRNVGGGIYLENSFPTITNCMITNNYAHIGGGLFLSASFPTITNCMIVRNWVTDLIHGGGGGIFLENSSPTITHCTVGSNLAGQYGGAIYCYGASPKVTNSILWGNSALYGSEIFVKSGSPVVTYSDVEGGWSGEGNIETNPSFLGEVTFRLGPGSPCVDSGTDAGVYTDMDGQRRPWGPGFDMGADEFSTEPCSVIASSGNQFMGLYMIPVLALILLRRRFLRR